MHYHLCDHIYISQYREDLILLDTKSNTYTICFPKFAELLLSAIEGKANSQSLDSIQKLLEDRIIEKKETVFPFYIDRKVDSEGVSDVDWQLPLDPTKINLNTSVLKAFLTLLQVHFYIKTRGFYATIRLIKKTRKTHLIYTFPSDEELKNLANILNKACLLYPIRTKCLEWAMTFVLLALRRQWKCNLEIGVQNYPFLAHAWVECNGKVVMDSQELRKGLAIILNEPFRKLNL
ncbi:MAG: lasso peptide biosynthesis B2 protein [Verrucomicrobia bacterium]|nr:lasso peptide biosynthesis B2 protein [Verrucomicrobiota bacterium]